MGEGGNHFNPSSFDDDMRCTIIGYYKVWVDVSVQVATWDEVIKLKNKFLYIILLSRNGWDIRGTEYGVVRGKRCG